MINIKKILVPTDLSPFSLGAVEYASTFCGLFKAELYLLYVINKIPYDAIPDLTGNMKKMYEGEIDNAYGKIEHYIKTHIKDCPSINKEITWGEPNLEIVGFAEKNNIDLIVMSSHVKPVTGEPEPGSITEKIMNKTSIPVMLIKARDIQESVSPETVP